MKAQADVELQKLASESDALTTRPTFDLQGRLVGEVMAAKVLPALMG